MVFLPQTSDLTLYLNALSLLFNVYLSQKPSVAKKLGELIEELKRLKGSPSTETREELDKRLEEKLLPDVEAAEVEAVKRDLDLVSVFADPIQLEDFDYVGTIISYGKKYAALADKASLFDLRGATAKDESMLFLPTAGRHLLTVEQATGLLCQRGFLTPISATEADVVLTKTGSEFGISFSVIANFNTYDRATYARRNVELGCRYVFQEEGRKNWIRLETRTPVDGFSWLKKRLDASDVLGFMHAVRSDVMKYVIEVKEEKSLILGEISALLQEVTDFFEPARKAS